MTDKPQPAAWDITAHNGYQFLQEAQDDWEPSPGQYAKAEPLYSAETVAALQAQIDMLERLRPHWAQGYTSDSVAAQSTVTALNQIWSILGVDNQTAAMDRLRQLTTTQPGWQPISTAPKDGTVILLGGCTWGPNVRVGSWGKARFNRSTRDYDPDWCSGSDQGGINPTHWMPLPQEPRT